MKKTLTSEEIASLPYAELKELVLLKKITTPDMKKATLVQALSVFYGPQNEKPQGEAPITNHDSPITNQQPPQQKDTLAVMQNHILAPLRTPWPLLMDTLRKIDFQLYQNILSKGDAEKRRVAIAAFFKSKLTE